MTQKFVSANFLSLILLILINTSCSQITTTEVPNNFEGLIPITNWNYIGPFAYDTLKQIPSETFYNEDLKTFGINENQFTRVDIAKLKGSYNSIDSTYGYLDIFDEFQEINYQDKGNIYLFTSIESPIEQDVYAILDYCNSLSLWVNSEKVFSDQYKKSTSKISNKFVRIKLKKGSNLIFAKLNRGSNNLCWRLIFNLAKDEEARRIYLANYKNDFIVDPNPLDSLAIYYGPFLPTEWEMQVFDYVNMPIKLEKGKNLTSSCKYLTKVDSLKSGFYTCRMIIPGIDSLWQQFYIGSPEKLHEIFVQSFEESAIRFRKEDFVKSMERYNWLLNSEHEQTEHENHYFNSNLVFYGYGIYQQLFPQVQIANSRAPFTGLKTYQPVNKTESECFLFHVGKNAIQKNNIPIIVVAPYSIHTDTYTTSWYLGNLDQIQADIRLADKYGFAIAWPFMGGASFSLNESIDEFEKILERIQSEYPIDTKRVMLMGDCEGARKAMLLASMKPDKVSSLGLFSPLVLALDKKISPIEFSSNLGNHNIMISYNEQDQVVSPKQSKLLIKMLSGIGVRPIVIKSQNGHFNPHKEYRRYAFHFFSEWEPLVNTPTKILLNTFDPDFSSAYWIKLIEIIPNSKATIEAEYDSVQSKFNIQTENVIRYHILLDKLNIEPSQNISVSNNGKLIYKGDSNQSRISIVVED